MNIEQPNISVCIACYNGERFIKNQILSILDQIGAMDELLIRDDCSSDQTVAVVGSIKDNRIKLFKNDINIGYIKNFEKLLFDAKNKYIFLSDQDDLWKEGRVNKMISACIYKKKSVIIGKFELIGKVKKSSNFLLSSKNFFTLNYFFRLLCVIIGKGINNYGCCMMIESGAIKYLLPFRSYVVGHDVWIAICSILRNDVYYLNDVVTRRRIHKSNLTSNDRSIIKKIKSRFDRLFVAYKEFLAIINEKI